MASREELKYLILGDTPVTQLLAWRLSLASCFIILVSTCISSDGLVAWKSNKLGSNFYKPNISTRDLSNLKKVYSSSPVDIVVVGSNSITQFRKQLHAITEILDEKTIILVDCTFGVELELNTLEYFPKNTVVGVLTDAEVRKLSTGSYALISDKISFQFGITYNMLEGESMKKNMLRYEELRKNPNSTFMTFLKTLGSSCNGDIEIHEGNICTFAITVWESVIPRISLNILSIVFEQTSYEELAKNRSNNKIFKQLVKELLNICYKQSMGMIIESFVLEKDIRTPDYENIVNKLKNKQSELEKFTDSEYPEFLTLCYEAYCFYHRVEFPCSLLLSQCITLAEKYNCPSDNLVFLECFCLRLLNLSGLKVEEDLNCGIAKPNLLFGRQHLFSVSCKEGVSGSCEDELLGRTKVKSKDLSRGMKLVESSHTLKSAEIQLPHELQEMYLKMDTSSFSPAIMPSSNGFDAISASNNCESEFPLTNEEFKGSFFNKDNQGQLNDYHTNLHPKKSLIPVLESKFQHNNDIIDNTLNLPFFKGFKNDVQRPITTGTLGIGSLEREIRNSNFDFSSQLYISSSQNLGTSTRVPYNILMAHYWRMLKKQHINNGQLPRPIHNQEDMLKAHSETLHKSQVQLSTATDRYGDLDVSTLLSEHWKHGEGGLYKQLSDR